MASFSFFAALLVALAIAFAVSALWQRSRPLAIALALALSLGAGALYWFKGEPAALDPANVAPPKTIPEAIAQLERLVAAHPDNFGDQAALARAYMAAGQFQRAGQAYASALRLKPEETDLYAEYAEALLRSSSDRRFSPEAVRMLEIAVAKNPQNQRALFFLGLHQRMSGRNAEAVATWERLLSQLDAATSEALRAQIAEARKAAGMPVAEAVIADSPQPLLQVEVRLSPALARAVPPGAALFVFARSVDGAGPPVAAKRIAPASWPIEVGLGDSDSPMPAAKLSSQREVLVAARLSRSGAVAPASGDIEAESVRVAVGDDTTVVLELDKAVP